MTIIFDPDTGVGLSQDVMRIGQIINDYDSTLSLSWIPPENRELNEEFPYAVVCTPINGPRYIVFRLRESEVDHRVIARLWGSDNVNGNVLDTIEANEAALRAIELLKQEEAAQEAHEKAAWMLNAKVGQRIGKVRLT